MKHLYGPRFRRLHCSTDRIMTDSLAQMDLTASQGRIMGYLACSPQPPCPRDIEEHFRLSHPSVSGTLSRLEKKGFIELRPDELDHRCKRIHMLPKGAQCHARIEGIIARIERQVTAGFTGEEQAQFTRLLDRAIQNLDAYPCEIFREEETE